MRSYDAPVVVLRKVNDQGAVPANVILRVPEPEHVDGEAPPVIVAETIGETTTSAVPEMLALQVDAGEAKETLVMA